MAGIQHEEHQFCCSVCLELLREPVTLSCGHNYCRGCIDGFWDLEKEKRKYSCPQCRETFRPRPDLRRNNMLAELVEKVKKTQPASPPAAVDGADVACDFCCDSQPQKATMSCLTCMASYCQAHLEPHYSVPVMKKHQLVSVSIPLQEKLCSEHNKLMEFYCCTDEQLICSLCSVDEHKTHMKISALAQKAKTEKHLVSSQKKIQKRVQQRERELNELSRTEENLKSCAQSALRDCDKIFGELISSMQRRHGEVKQLIVDQEKAGVAQAEELQLQRREEITKLKRRDAELELLSHAEDHIRLIQMFQVLPAYCDFPDDSPVAGPLRSFRDVTDCVSELRDKLEAVVKDMWPRISAAVSYVDFPVLPAPKTREEFLRYCRPLTLDATSNYQYLHLICDNLRVRPSPSSYAAHPDRFAKFPQVLCREGLSDRCYWEVEGHARTLSVAVAYKDVNRTSDESLFGRNDKSWSLERTADGYSFHHNNVKTTVSGVRCVYAKKIGVFLDYKVGTLCFYHVSDTMVPIHEVHTTFTKPLYPGIGLNYEWYDVGVFAQLVKLW